MIVHTGWGKLWGKDNARYSRGNPGLGVAASEWLARQDPMLVGADTAPVEVCRIRIRKSPCRPIRSCW